MITRVAFLLMVFCPLAVVASEFDALDIRIRALEQERGQKLEQLLKCEKETRGFKIAGISTLAATGVGIYANVKLNERRQNLVTGANLITQDQARSAVANMTLEEKQEASKNAVDLSGCNNSVRSRCQGLGDRASSVPQCAGCS